MIQLAADYGQLVGNGSRHSKRVAEDRMERNACWRQRDLAASNGDLRFHSRSTKLTCNAWLPPEALELVVEPVLGKLATRASGLDKMNETTDATSLASFCFSSAAGADSTAASSLLGTTVLCQIDACPTDSLSVKRKRYGDRFVPVRVSGEPVSTAFKVMLHEHRKVRERYELEVPSKKKRKVALPEHVEPMSRAS